MTLTNRSFWSRHLELCNPIRLRFPETWTIGLLLVWTTLVFPAANLAQTKVSPTSKSRQEPLQVELLRSVRLQESAYEWNWAAWDQEKIVSVGDYQYSVFWSAKRTLCVGRRDLRSDQVQTIELSRHRLSRNDRHRNTCLGVSLADGRLHLSWDHHVDDLNYTRSRAGWLSDPPKDISASDFEPAQPMLEDPALETQVTYPRFFTDRDGQLFSFYRRGKSGNGDNYLQSYDPKSGKWTRLGRVASHLGTYVPWNHSTSRNAYFQDLRFDENNRLHAIWTYREVSSTWASNHDLHYAYSDDLGRTWKNNQGQQVADLQAGDPIQLDDPGLVVIDIPVHSWLMNAGPMNFDSQNRPHIVTFKASQVQPGDSTAHDPSQQIRDQLVYVHYWRDHDGRFRGGKAILPGAHGIFRGDVIFDPQDNLLFYYPTDAGLEYYWASAQDQWETFHGPFALLPPEFQAPQRNSTKHDQLRWQRDGILSFTVQPPGGGFGIVDLKWKPRGN